MTSRACGLLATVVALVASCATAVPQGGALVVTPRAKVTPATADGTVWTAEVQAATRRHEPYSYTMRLADLRATLVTPRLRQAFAHERERFHGRFAKDATRELLHFGTVDEGVDAEKVIARPESEEQILVFVAFYAANQKYRDLSTKGSIWDTTLRRGSGPRVRPVAIESVRLTPAVIELFPYVDRFDDLYLVRFPSVDRESGAGLLAPGDAALHLEVASAVATCDVSWTLDAGSGE